MYDRHKLNLAGPILQGSHGVTELLMSYRTGGVCAKYWVFKGDLERGIVLLYMTRKLNNSHFFTGNELWMARF